MRLDRFKVTNYRNIRDSGWIRVSDVTALVGPNEAGKSNVFEALYNIKPLNPKDAYIINEDWPVDDWPGKKAAADKLVAHAVFELKQDDVESLFEAAQIPLPPIADVPEGTSPPPVPAAPSLPTSAEMHARRNYTGPTLFSFEFGDGFGNLIDSAKLQTWAAANITAIDPLADATPNGNPDNDGLSNLAEFGLNGNPLSGVNDGKVVSKIATVGGVPSLVLTLPVRTVATFSGATEQVSSLVSGLVYHIQGSAALSSWTVPVSEVTNPGEKAAIEAGLPAVDSGWSYRTFTTGPVSAASADFLRAVIEQP